MGGLQRTPPRAERRQSVLEQISPRENPNDAMQHEAASNPGAPVVPPPPPLPTGPQGAQQQLPPLRDQDQQNPDSQGAGLVHDSTADKGAVGGNANPEPVAQLNTSNQGSQTSGSGSRKKKKQPKNQQSKNEQKLRLDARSAADELQTLMNWAAYQFDLFPLGQCAEPRELQSKAMLIRFVRTRLERAYKGIMEEMKKRSIGGQPIIQITMKLEKLHEAEVTADELRALASAMKDESETESHKVNRVNRSPSPHTARNNPTMGGGGTARATNNLVNQSYQEAMNRQQRRSQGESVPFMHQQMSVPQPGHNTTGHAVNMRPITQNPQYGQSASAPTGPTGTPMEDEVVSASTSESLAEVFARNSGPQSEQNRRRVRLLTRPTGQVGQGSQVHTSVRQQLHAPQQQDATQQQNAPQPQYMPQQQNAPQPQYLPQHQYLPQQQYMPQRQYLPQQQFVPQQQFMPQQQYVPQQQYMPQQQAMPHQQAMPQQQYVPQPQYLYPQNFDREAGDAYYSSLPVPWNIVPTIPAAQGEDVFKNITKGRLIVFDGKRANYDAWRDKFIHLIHLKRTNPASKALALQASLDKANVRLKLLAESITFSERGYMDVLKHLEAEYGGSHRLRMEKLKQVLAVQYVRVGDVGSILEFELKVKCYIDAVDQDNTPEAVDVEDETFVKTASKLDQHLTMRFTDFMERSGQPACIRTLHNFLVADLAKCRQMGDYASANSKPSRYSTNRTYVAGGGDDEDVDDGEEAFAFASEELQGAPDCDACTGQHLLRDCKKFLGMTAQDRFNLIREKKRCFRCLRLGHGVMSCQSKAKCKQCDKMHHTLLHGAKTSREQKQELEAKERTMMMEEEENFNKQSADDDDVPIKVISAAFRTAGDPDNTLGTAPVELVSPDGTKKIQINALLDSGNTVTLLSEQAAHALNLKGYQDFVAIEGVGGQTVQSQLKAKVTLCSTDGKVRETIWARIVPKPAGSLKAVDWNEYKSKFAHLKHLEFPKPCERRTVEIGRASCRERCGWCRSRWSPYH